MKKLLMLSPWKELGPSPEAVVGSIAYHLQLCLLPRTDLERKPEQSLLGPRPSSTPAVGKAANPCAQNWNLTHQSHGLTSSSVLNGWWQRAAVHAPVLIGFCQLDSS